MAFNLILIFVATISRKEIYKNWNIKLKIKFEIILLIERIIIQINIIINNITMIMIITPAVIKYLIDLLQKV